MLVVKLIYVHGIKQELSQKLDYKYMDGNQLRDKGSVKEKLYLMILIQGYFNVSLVAILYL